MGYLYDAEANHFVRIDKDISGLPQLMWHITYQCGLHCKFCFAKKKTETLDIFELNRYIDKFKQLLIQKIDISGGEPLLSPFLQEISDALYNNGIHMTLTTRGIGLEKNLQWVVENREKFSRTIVSLDAPEPSIFDELSGDADSFEDTQVFISRLVDKQYNKIRVNTVVTKYLLDNDVLAKMIHLISHIGCQEWCLIEPHPANKTATFDQVVVNNSEFVSVVDKVRKAFGRNPDCRILVRKASNYAGYWVLYPEGLLAKHTDHEMDTLEMDFLDTSTDVIMNRIANSNLWIPEDK